MRSVSVRTIAALALLFAGCEAEEQDFPLVAKEEDFPATADSPIHNPSISADPVAEIIAQRQEISEIELQKLAAKLEAEPLMIDTYERGVREARRSGHEVHASEFMSSAGRLPAALEEYRQADRESHGLGITIIGSDGQPFSSLYYSQYARDLADSPTLDAFLPGYDIRREVWFLEAIARREPVWSGPYHDLREGPPRWLITYSIPLIRDSRVYMILATDLIVPPPPGLSSRFYETASSYQSTPPAYGRNPVPRGFPYGNTVGSGNAVGDSARLTKAWLDHLEAWKSHARGEYVGRRQIAEAAHARLAAEIGADIPLVDRHPVEGYEIYPRDYSKEPSGSPFHYLKDYDYSKDPVYQRLMDYMESYPDLLGSGLTLLRPDGEPYFSIWLYRYSSYGPLQLSEGVSMKDQLDPWSQLDIRDQPWFVLPRARQTAVWTAPYWDIRHDYTVPEWTISRSVPLMRGDTVYAVVTTDLRADLTERPAPPDRCGLYRREIVEFFCPE